MRRAADSSCALYAVSIYELIANAAAYHGKPVQVVGFAHFEFEGDALYAHRSDWERKISRNGLWIALSDSSAAAQTQNQYVLLEGIFDAQQRGHYGMWSGTIHHIRRLERWELSPIPPLDSIPQIDLRDTGPPRK